MKYIASVSFGKDSLAMLLMLIEKQYPLDEVVFYDTEMEFQAIYNLRDKIKTFLSEKGIQYTELKPDEPFEYKMFERPVCKQGTNMVYKHGYGWCGGIYRWGTGYKLKSIENHCKGHSEYVGIALDEPGRLVKERNGFKTFPLAEWGMTEKDCLEYCYAKGYGWLEDTIDLYSILDRVSCWSCRNKNLKELRAMYNYLPAYWAKLKKMQSRLAEPMKGNGKSVFDLEKRFAFEVERKKAGLSIRNREFYSELKGIIKP